MGDQAATFVLELYDGTDDKKPAFTLNLLSYSWGNVAGIRSPTGSAGRTNQPGPTIRDIVFQVTQSKDSPLLFQAVATGKHFGKAVLTSSKADGPKMVPYLTLDMTDCLLSSAQSSGSGNGSVPVTESYSMVFGSLSMRH